jgi:hypothetical protein
MADLGTKWDAKFDALGKQRVIASIHRRQIPKPGNDAKRLEAELLHGTAYGSTAHPMKSVCVAC